jgi:hypothetical protein
MTLELHACGRSPRYAEFVRPANQTGSSWTVPLRTPQSCGSTCTSWMRRLRSIVCQSSHQAEHPSLLTLQRLPLERPPESRRELSDFGMFFCAPGRATPPTDNLSPEGEACGKTPPRKESRPFGPGFTLPTCRQFFRLGAIAHNAERFSPATRSTLGEEYDSSSRRCAQLNAHYLGL